MPGHKPEQQAGRRTAVTHIQNAGRFRKFTHPDTVDTPQPVRPVSDLRAHMPQGFCRVENILPLKQAADQRLPLSQRSEHQRPVRHGFIARHAHRSFKRPAASGLTTARIFGMRHGKRPRWRKKSYTLRGKNSVLGRGEQSLFAETLKLAVISFDKLDETIDRDRLAVTVALNLVTPLPYEKLLVCLGFNALSDDFQVQ